jgi:hypothetical protein
MSLLHLLLLALALWWPIVAPAAVAQTPTRISAEDLRKTMEHIQQLTRLQQGVIDELREQNAVVTVESKRQILELAAARELTGSLQRQIDDLSKYAEEQKEAAKYWHQKHGEAVKKLWWWRIWGWTAIILGLGLIFVGIALRFTKWGAGVTANIARAAAKF